MPDAPQPSFDSHGNVVAAWFVMIAYDPAQDVISVHSHRGSGSYLPSRTLRDTFTIQDVEDAVAWLQREARILGSPRLF